MAFIIDTDHTANAGNAEGTNANAVGITGPRTASPAAIGRLTAGEGEQFRMYDDDDELYYEGRWVADPDVPDEAFEGFEPLDCFGAPNAGCTRLDYRNDATGEWARL
jgi:hypothetical protein